MSEPEYFEPAIITMGDPAGIGPEIVHKALQLSSILHRRDVLVVGDALAFCKSVGGAEKMHAYHIAPFEDFMMDPVGIVEAFESYGGVRGRPIFIDIGDSTDEIEPGVGSPESGMLALSSFNASLEMLDQGVGAMLVTAPFAKQWVQAAGFNFPGHTEALGEYCGNDPVMMLLGGGLKVTLVTVHEPIAKLSQQLSEEKISATVVATHLSLKNDFGIERPRIAVCGLNPHAGEGGKIGDEELKVITPAVEALKDDGLLVSGPYSGDTIFHRASQGEFDAVVAMYHDQGAIPVKLKAFAHGVNFTANLSIVRTSPDHGTAYDIAGQNKADPRSMLAAIDLADAIVRRRAGEHVAETLAERHVPEADAPKPATKVKQGD